jgi:hypothetical protein
MKPNITTSITIFVLKVLVVLKVMQTENNYFSKFYLLYKQI